MDIDTIRQSLPHRFPFLMIDKILELEKGKRAVVVKNVTINEPFFQGHYPQYPVMPGVLIIEAMAQAGGLAAASNEGGLIPLLTGVDQTRFRVQVRPGDQLVITATVLKQRSKVVKIAAVAKVDGKTVAEGELTFVLTERGVSKSNDTSKSNDHRK